MVNLLCCLLTHVPQIITTVFGFISRTEDRPWLTRSSFWIRTFYCMIRKHPLASAIAMWCCRCRWLKRSTASSVIHLKRVEMRGGLRDSLMRTVSKAICPRVSLWRGPKGELFRWSSVVPRHCNSFLLSCAVALVTTTSGGFWSRCDRGACRRNLMSWWSARTSTCDQADVLGLKTEDYISENVPLHSSRSAWIEHHCRPGKPQLKQQSFDRQLPWSCWSAFAPQWRCDADRWAKPAPHDAGSVPNGLFLLLRCLACPARKDQAPESRTECLFGSAARPRRGSRHVGGESRHWQTLLALAAGLHRCWHLYARLLVTRPPISLGRDLGHLPGTLEEKLGPWMKPIIDNIDFITGSALVSKRGAQDPRLSRGIFEIRRSSGHGALGGWGD